MNRNKYFAASLMMFIFSFICQAQNPTVEDSFQPALSKTSETPYVLPFVQADGKVIIAGRFQTVNGLIRFNVSRQNTDGSTDTTFNCPACAFNVSNVSFQSDGKILVGGQAYISQSEKIIRVNTDGSLDNSFSYAPSGNSNSSTLTVKGVQSDGKILVINRITGSSSSSDSLFRLNADGSKDNSFQTLTVNSGSGQSLDAEIFPDGRTFVYGNNTYGFLALLNGDGTKSSLFDSPALTDSSSTPIITDITLQPDGKIAFIGRFTTVNGLNRKNSARLNADQSIDATFNPSQFVFPFSSGDGQIIALSNNKLLIGGTTLVNTSPRIVRLNSDGTTDAAFNLSATVFYFWRMQIDSEERIYVGGVTSFPNGASFNLLTRFNTDGSLDTTYAPDILVGGTVSALGLQTDGKILVGGNYAKANGLSRKGVSRINADGSTDPTFDAGETFTGLTINDFAVQTDGKILVGAVSNTLKRLNANGSVDAGFNVTLNGSVNEIALQPDGKILIGGIFSNVNGTPKNTVARLNADGTLDSAFNAQLGTGSSVSRIVVQADGKIMIGGNFSGINGSNRSHLVRLNSDGSLDSGFNAAVNALVDLTVQPDGKYLALSSTRIYRLLTDGSVDGSFTSPTLTTIFGIFSTFVLLNDGTIVVSGNLNVVNGFAFFNYVRIKSDGSLDTTSFSKMTEAPAKVLLKQPDGKVLAGGDFKIFENLPRTGLARLVFPALVRPTLFDYDGDGRADISVYRPSNSTWYQLVGANYQFSQRTFGANGDIPVPGDYDADGKTDFAIWRPSENGITPSKWIYITSRDNTQRTYSWGSPGDIPLPSDFNGDGVTDFVVYRPSNNVWYRYSNATSQFTELYFGLPGDKPLIGDFDGDGRSDYAIYRPSTGVWWYAASSAGNAFRAAQWGIAEDIPVAADYDGDGKTDFAVFRPSNGVWYILNSGNGTATIIQFGLTGDKPIAADYDGDGRSDIAVFRPSNGNWYLLRTTAGFGGLQWGISSDIPLPNAFIQQ